MQTQAFNTDLTFFTNEPDHTLWDRFVQVLKNVKYFDILVGYFRSSGFFRLYRSFENIEKIRILIGLGIDRQAFEIIDAVRTNDFASHAEIKNIVAQKIVAEAEKAPDTKEVEDGILKFVEYIKTGKIEIKAHPSRKIHAKVYISRFYEGDRDFGNVITGSSNFSESGLVANYEFNVQLKNSSDVKYALEKFEQLWSEAVDISGRYVDTITQRTHLSDKITPYEVYLKFLYEYFETDLSVDDELFFQNLPSGFLRLKYQEQAVINARKILEEYGGVFLADVVGLGKTFVSAMLARQLPGRNLVIASPTLLDEDNPNSWKNVFYGFGISAKYASAGNLEKFIRRNDDNYENVFIDEAHKFRNETNISYENLSRICAGKKVILVTATPLNNSPEDIRAQIKLFQNTRKSTIPGVRNLDQFFSGLQRQLKGLDRRANYQEYMETVKEISRKIREKVLKHIMVRRTRSEIEKYFSKDLREQNLKFPEVESPTAIFYQFDERLDKIFMDTIKLITDENMFHYARYSPLLYLKEELTQFERTSQQNMRGFMKILLVKRLESSFFAFKNTLRRFIDSYRKFISAYEKGAVYLSKKYWNKVIDYFLNDDLEAIQKLIDEEKAEEYKAELFQPELLEALKTDLKTLQKIQTWWEEINYDPKLDEFLNELKSNTTLSQNKIIIFTESKETAEYLQENLQPELGEAILLFHGNSTRDSLRTVIDNFDANAKYPADDYRVLVTTEVLSEGVNLHRANVVINYDLPWNPTRMIQRVGRVNRVDTPFDKIYTFNFFPTEQSNDLIKLKEAAVAKISYFIEMLGNDAKLLTDGEEIKSFELFNKLTSKEFITGEDEEESELKYLQVIQDIRDNDKELFAKVKKMPKKIRTARALKDNEQISANSLLTYFRKGKLEKFYLAKEGEASEVDFLTAAKLFETQPQTRREQLLPDYHDLLVANKQALKNDMAEQEMSETAFRGSRDNMVRILKILKSREMRSYQGFTNWDEEYLQSVCRLLEQGALPKTTAARIYKLIKDETDPMAILKIIRRTLPDEFLKKLSVSGEKWRSHPEEVILSECLVK